MHFSKLLAIALLSFGCASPPPPAVLMLSMTAPVDGSEIPTHTALPVRFVADHDGAYALTITRPGGFEWMLARGQASKDSAVDVEVAADALAWGTNSVNVLVFSGNKRPARAGVTITVRPQPAELKSVAALAFGDRAPGAELEQTLSVRNAGDLDAVLADVSAASLGIAPPFALRGGSCQSGNVLQGGDSCTLIVAHAPALPETGSGVLTLAYTGADGTSATLQVALSASSTCTPPATATVVAYDAAALRWNDYVVTAAPQTPCIGNEPDFRSCTHGGERRKLVVPGRSSCAGLTASDTLSAFEWMCNDTGPEVYFFSPQLARGRGLADLLLADGSGFAPNAITVRDATTCAIAASTPNVWWTNEVVPLPTGAGVQTLSGAANIGKIFTLGSDAAVDGIAINANKVALVTLAGATLRYGGAAVGCAPTSAERNLVCLPSNFVWIEGMFSGRASSGANADNIFKADGAKFWRLNRATLKTAEHNAVWGFGIAAGTFTDVRVDGFALSTSDGAAISLNTNSAGSLFDGWRIADGPLGLAVRSIGQRHGNNVLHDIFISNVQRAISLRWLSDPENVTLTKLHISGTTTANATVAADNAPSTFLFTTIANATGEGVELEAPATLGQTLVWNVGSHGIWSESFSGATLARTAAVHTGGFGIRLTTPDHLVRAGLWLGDNSFGGCSVNPSTGNELDGACLYGAVPPTRPADSTLLSLVGELVGPVSDAVNPSGVGPIAGASISDWLSFASPWRAFGREDSAAFPALNHRGGCKSGMCQAFDLRFKPTSQSPLRGVNGTFIAGAACPASVDATNAANVLSDQQVPPNTFLLSALEIVRDFAADGARIGDDDGLCESGEACIFSPNIGAYQGDGEPDTQAPCSFSGGNGVQNVTVYGLATNGG